MPCSFRFKPSVIFSFALNFSIPNPNHKIIRRNHELLAKEDAQSTGKLSQGFLSRNSVTIQTFPHSFIMDIKQKAGLNRFGIGSKSDNNV